ncbi:MAG: methyltransferase domain-containing protein [archaeon]|nr:methyltransferase domain-containing protein [archaeon]
MIKLNLGCGQDYKRGYINIDSNKNIEAEIHCDLSKKIPFKNNSVDEVYCKNMFEHIPEPLKFLLEIKRILKNGGKAIIITSNGSYILYHFPRKRAYHDTYNLSSLPGDKHYFFFQKGHLVAFTDKVEMKLKKLEYYIADARKSKNRLAQIILGAIFGKKFGYSDFLWVLEK